MTTTRADAAKLPRHADTIIVGGGSAGAVIAARMAERADQSVLLLEAGPDYGPLDSGQWPDVLLDCGSMPITEHSWNYVSAAKHGALGLTLARARVIGGCSSHNGCAAVWGHRADYDGWAAAGNRGWSTNELLPLFQTVNSKLSVHTPTRDQISPWHRACLDSAITAGLPFAAELNDFDFEHGITIGPLNAINGVRRSTAFGYLDPVRASKHLTIVGDALVDRVVVKSGRVVGVDVVTTAGISRVAAGRVVLAGGAYGSPLLLLRSGIGQPDQLSAHGVPVIHPLPGVGKNLQDHPSIGIVMEGTPGLARAMDEFAASHVPFREEGTIVNAKSSLCKSAFDLHLYPWSHRASCPSLGSKTVENDHWVYAIFVALMETRSIGEIRLSSRDPEAQPIIDHAYFTDPENHDLEAIIDGFLLARYMAAAKPLAKLAGAELEPGPRTTSRADLRAWVTKHSGHDYHPVGTCKMGPASDPAAVVDHRGVVHGLDQLYVADASIMPVVPRANTNIPAVVVGEKIASLL